MDIRLVNGSQNCSGRLEVYNEDQWGTLCDVSTDIAQLVCRDLGCGYAASAPQASLFGEGTGPVWKPSIECVPGRSQIHCTIIPMQTTSCNHSEDAGVICSDILNIRLANGANNCSGRVEFYYKDQWEAGCGDYWDMRHAQVVCRELGCGYAVSAPVGARFGNRTAPYWRKGFHCSGEEQSLISCSVNDLTTCHKDASVICSGMNISFFHLILKYYKIMKIITALKKYIYLQRSAPNTEVCSQRSAPNTEVCSQRSAPNTEVCSQRSAPNTEVCSQRSAPNTEVCSQRSAPSGCVQRAGLWLRCVCSSWSTLWEQDCPLLEKRFSLFRRRTISDQLLCKRFDNLS
ncbi:UNVERIFIED_CONTAM: hypothetical protein FKN15_067989 [Acipenser sinensis]